MTKYEINKTENIKNAVKCEVCLKKTYDYKVIYSNFMRMFLLVCPDCFNNPREWNIFVDGKRYTDNR